MREDVNRHCDQEECAVGLTSCYFQCKEERAERSADYLVSHNVG